MSAYLESYFHRLLMIYPASLRKEKDIKYCIQQRLYALSRCYIQTTISPLYDECPSTSLDLIGGILYAIRRGHILTVQYAHKEYYGSIMTGDGRNSLPTFTNKIKYLYIPEWTF